MRLCTRQIKLTARLLRLPRLQIAALELLMVIQGFTGSAQNLNSPGFSLVTEQPGLLVDPSINF